MSESLNKLHEGKRAARRFKVPGPKVIRIFAAWRLCVSHTYRAETYGDSCNSSLQYYEHFICEIGDIRGQSNPHPIPSPIRWAREAIWDLWNSSLQLLRNVPNSKPETQ